MIKTLVLKAEAEADLSDAYAWYEARRIGLGDEFLMCVEAALKSIQRHPRLYKVVHEDVQRCLVRRFPYGVFFVDEPDRLVVLGVLHCRQRPDKWRGRRQPRR